MHESLGLYLAVELLVAGDTQGEDGSRAGRVTYGLVAVLDASVKHHKEKKCKFKVMFSALITHLIVGLCKGSTQEQRETHSASSAFLFPRPLSS